MLGMVLKGCFDDGAVMFFYGTFKRGERKREHYCGGALLVEEGAVRGDLYDVLLGYPALVVPEESVCAFGTGDYRGTRRSSNGSTVSGHRRRRVLVSSVRSSFSTILSRS